MKKTLLVDMDGVLADVYAQFQACEAQKFGAPKPEAYLMGKWENEAFPLHDEYVNNGTFFIDAPVMPGSPAVLEELNRAYDLFIVSAAMQFPTSLTQKQTWLGVHFPFIRWQQIIFCGTKRQIQGDVMIDDHFSNLDIFTGEGILFTQPHNQLKDAGKNKRVHTWTDIAAYLL
jgi:5'(3')-deoxyribonucleotidase